MERQEKEMQIGISNITVQYSDGEIKTIDRGCILSINDESVSFCSVPHLTLHELGLMFYGIYNVCFNEVGPEQTSKLVEICKLAIKSESKKNKETSEGEE